MTLQIADKVQNFNILVIDDDPMILQSVKPMYELMINMGEFRQLLGEKAQGTVSTAANTKEAEDILRRNFEADPKVLQIMHVDERMPGERGSEFVDRMRWTYAGRRIGE